MASAPRRQKPTATTLAIACAVVAAAVAGTALIARAEWGATAVGKALRLWGIAGVLGAVVIATRGTVARWAQDMGRGCRPAAPSSLAQAVVGGLGLGGLMALGNMVAAREMAAAPELRYPFGQETIELWPAVAVVGIIAPTVEELFFRGILLRYLWATRGATVAVIVSAAAFALGHGEPSLMPQAALGGLILGIAYVRFGAVIAPILAHSLGNLAYVLLAKDSLGWAIDLSPTVLLGAAVVCLAALVWAGGARRPRG